MYISVTLCFFYFFFFFAARYKTSQILIMVCREILSVSSDYRESVLVFNLMLKVAMKPVFIVNPTDV